MTNQEKVKALFEAEEALRVSKELTEYSISPHSHNKSISVYNEETSIKFDIDGNVINESGTNLEATDEIMQLFNAWLETDSEIEESIITSTADDMPISETI